MLYKDLASGVVHVEKSLSYFSSKKKAPFLILLMWSVLDGLKFPEWQAFSIENYFQTEEYKARFVYKKRYLYMKLKSKIIFLCLGSLLGYSVMAFYQFNSAQNEQRKEIRAGFSQYGQVLESSSSQVFHTLYHNVQAFTRNSAFKEKKVEDASFVMNELVNLYQIYDAMIFVDANGTFVAANDLGPDGKKLNIEHLKSHNWSQEKWFKDAKDGKFTEDMKKKIFGTRVGQFETDGIIKKMYGADKKGQHFTTIVDDGFGGVLGVLTTYAGSRWVQQEINSLEYTLKESGKENVAISFLAKDGSVVAENVAAAGIHDRFEDVKENLVKGDLEAFSGSDDLWAYAKISNERFIDELGWQVVLSMKSDHAFATISSSASLFNWSLFFGLIVVCAVSVWSGHAISKQLKAIADTVFHDSNIVSSTSEELAVSSSQLSDASNQQAASLQETASSLDEINAMVKQNSELCFQSSEKSEKSKDAARKGQDAIKRMTHAMDAIKEQNNQIVKEMENNNQEIRAVIKVISEIEQKTRVINDIVFQTKLLSFNASVEAARAGEHGKGFAVVAEEVGNLAEMSGKSAKEISDLLTASLSNVENIINSTSTKLEGLITNGRVKVEEGMKIVKENEESLTMIFENVVSVNDMMKAIANASQEQAVGLQEISKAMNNLDATTHSNTEVAYSSSQSTFRLNEQVGSLKGAAQSLMKMVEGQKSEMKFAPAHAPVEANNNVLQLNKGPKKSVAKAPVHQEVQKKVVGLEFTPSHDDDRFEDI